MAQDKVEIANIALAKLGQRAITSFIQSGSRQATAIKAVYDDILEEVLSEHPWTFAQKRVALVNTVPDDVSRTIEEVIFTPVTITGATAADPVVITANNHGLQNGDQIYIEGVSGMTELNGNTYYVTDKTNDTFELMDEDNTDIDGSGFTAYTSGGQIHKVVDSTPILITGATAADPVVITATAHGLSDGDWVKIVGVAGMTNLNDNYYTVDDATTNTFSLDDKDDADVDGSAYSAYTFGGRIYKTVDLPFTEDGIKVVYNKPSDFIKPIAKSAEDAIVRVEMDKIVSDTTGLKIIYTFKNQMVSTYFPKFVQALATRLASEIAFEVTNSTKKASDLLELYHKVVLPSAVAVDSTQGTPEEPRQDEWLDARLAGSGQVATTGETWHSF